MIFGAPGTGKTFVALDLALDAVMGRAAGGGIFAVERPLIVDYATSEGASGLADRLRAAVGARGLDPRHAGLRIWTLQPQLFDSGPSGAAGWVESVQMAGDRPDLVIIDTLHGATAGADENSARDMGMVLASVKHIRDMLGCAVLLVHHANKQGSYRGSSALHGAVDFMGQIDGDGDNWSLTCAKLKDGRGWEPQGYRLMETGESAIVEWTGPLSAGPERDSLAESITTWLGGADRIGTYHDAPQIASGLSRETTDNAMRVLKRALCSLVAGKQILRQGDGRRGTPYVYGIDLSAGQLPR